MLTRQYVSQVPSIREYRCVVQLLRGDMCVVISGQQVIVHFYFSQMFQPFVATATVAAMHHFEIGADAQQHTAFSLSSLILYNNI